MLLPNKVKIKYVVAIKSIQLTITNINAFFGVIVPFGISLTSAVLGFAKSIFLSIYLLNAIAALLANTIHNTTNTKESQLILEEFKLMAKKKPIIANGRAKIVWLNFISDK